MLINSNHFIILKFLLYNFKACPPGCKSCFLSNKNESLCSVCFDGFYLSNNTCIACTNILKGGVSGCSLCILNDPIIPTSTCLSCIDPAQIVKDN